MVPVKIYSKWVRLDGSEIEMNEANQHWGPRSVISDEWLISLFFLYILVERMES